MTYIGDDLVEDYIRVLRHGTHVIGQTDEEGDLFGYGGGQTWKREVIGSYCEMNIDDDDVIYVAS